MKKFTVLILSIICILITQRTDLFAQPGYLLSQNSSWSYQSLTDRGVVNAITIQAIATNTNSGFKFTNTTGTNPQWCGSNVDYYRNKNSRLSGQSYYATGLGGWEHNLEFATTLNYYYTFIVGKNSSSNNDLSILETSYNPVTISSVSQSPTSVTSSEDVTITANLSGTLNSGEYCFLRYSTNNWSTSTILPMTTGTNPYTAIIPVYSASTVVRYYVFTSNNSSPALSDVDYLTLNLNNNSGVNYSYTITAGLPRLLTKEFTNQSGTSGNADFLNGFQFESIFANNYTFTASSSISGDRYFRFKDITGNQIHQASTDGTIIPLNNNTPFTDFTIGSTNRYKINVTNTSYKYFFRTNNVVSRVAIFEIQNSPLSTISTVTHLPATVRGGEVVAVTATLNADLPLGQAVWLRYTTDNFTNSTCLKMTGTGISYTANIPYYASGTLIKYYVFSSGDVTSISHADADLYTLNWNNNSGSNYSYTVSDLPSPTLCNVTAFSQNQLDLNWTQNGTYNNVIVVVREGSAPNDLTQGVSYNVNDGGIATAAGFILYKGSLDYSVTKLNHLLLNAGTTYYYKFFTENNNYYSPAVSVNKATYTSSQKVSVVENGNWNDAATWSPIGVPLNTEDVFINTNVILNSNGDVLNLTINSGKTLTSENATARTLTIAATGSFSNNGTFTANNGKVVFAGAGTYTGTTTFNNLDIYGILTQNGTTFLNGILEVHGGAFATNSITYNPSSTLKYYTNYDINSGDKLWFSNNASSGIAQLGVPWNVEVVTPAVVQLNDNFPFYINGNFTNAGTFRLGTISGSNYGDFYLSGNFINNGTFQDNARTVFFKGAANQQISGTTTPTTFANIVVNNSANLNLLQNIIVSTSVTFTNGKIILGNFNTTLGNAVINTPSSAKYFVTDGTGYLIQNVAGVEKTFHVGTSTSYAPAFLTQAGTAEALSVRVSPTITNVLAPFDASFAVNLQWTINESDPGNNTITTKFQWNTSDQAANFNITAPVKIGRYISGSYTTSLATVTGTTASAALMTSPLAEVPFVVGNSASFGGFKTAQDGDWNTGTTWIGGAVPTAGAVCSILHHVTSSSPIVNAADEIIIYQNKSLTLNTGGTVTVNTLTNNGMLKTNDATATVNIAASGVLNNSSTASINMVGNGIINFGAGSSLNNSGSFTSGIGTVNFIGTGTASGTLAFNNLNISGGNVDLGTATTLNGTLTLSGTGDIITHEIIYASNSNLVFDKNYSVASNILWKSDATTGLPQAGIPWNVEVKSGSELTIVGSNYRAINGNMTNNGTFILSDTEGGDFKLQGDFINNGTFTHNGRFVKFEGTVNQKIIGATTFYDLIVQNNANVTLQNNITVANILNFATGKIVLGSSNLTMGATATYTAVGSSKYIVTDGSGYLIQQVAASSTKLYPIGTMFSYNPATLTQGSGASTDNLGVKVKSSIDSTVNNPTQIVNCQWTINEAVAGGNNLSTKFQWNLTDEASSFSRVGTVVTKYLLSGSGYLPALPTASTVSGSNPFDATSGDVYTGSLSNLPFIVANNTAFTGGIETFQAGQWNNTATWVGGVIPGTGNAAIIKHAVTLDVAPIISPIVKSISITSVGSLTCGTQTINIDNGGAISNSGTFTAGTGTVIFTTGASTSNISTGPITFYNVILNGGVSFGSNTTIGAGGSLTINSGGLVSTNPPNYAADSKLIYNTGAPVNRGAEWNVNTSSGAGYPGIVQVSNSTTFNENKAVTDELYCRGIIIDDLSAYNMLSTTTKSLIVDGNLTIDGNINLSGEVGGDLKLTGNLTGISPTINWGGGTPATDKGRAVFFTGTGTQNITGISAIPFLLITKTGTVTLFDNNLTIDGEGTNFISITGGGKIELNGHNLISTGAGNIDLGNVAGAKIYGNGRIEFSGGAGTFSGINSGTLEISSNSTLAINGGILTFPSTLGIVTILGTLEVGQGSTITNIPTYGAASTLHYKKSGAVSIGDEWAAGSNVADNIPYNVKVGTNATDISTFTLDKTRTALGTFTVENYATVNVSPAIGQLTVNDLTVNTGGLIILKSSNDASASGSLITNGIVSGSVGTMKAERWFRTGWSYFATPVTSSSESLFNPILNPPVANTMSYNEGTDLFDATHLFSTNFHPDSLIRGWNYVTDASTLNFGNGYITYENAEKIVTFTNAVGEGFNTGDKTLNLSYTVNDINVLYSPDNICDGWNLIGNPYPSAVDADLLTFNNVDKCVYFWNGEKYFYYLNGGTNLWAGGSSTNTNTNVDKIPAMQSFFVHANSTSSPSVTFHNVDRVHSTQNYNKSNSINPTNIVRLKITKGPVTDDCLIHLNQNATNNYDGDFDAIKIFPIDLLSNNIYTFSNNTRLAINGLSLNSFPNIIPVGLKCEPGNYVISAEDISLENLYVLLIDKTNNTSIDLRTETLSFNYTQVGEISDRFEIHFVQNSAPVANGTLANQSGVYGTSVNFVCQNIFTDPDASLGDVITLFATMNDGSNLPSWLSFNSSTLSFTGNPVAAGDYNINLIATDNMGASTTASFAINIQKAELQISAINVQRNYNTQNPSFTANYLGFVNNEDEFDLNQMPTISSSATQTSAAGEYEITAANAQSNNYIFNYIPGVLTINAILPEITTVEANSISSNSATLVGNWISNGGELDATHGFCWSQNPTPTIANDFILNTSQFGNYSTTVSGLNPETVYYFRSYAQNSVGIQYGNIIQFSTLASGVNDISTQYNIYPNPCYGKFFVTAKSNALVEVYSISGLKISEINIKKNTQTRIDISKFAKGLYFVKISNNNNNFVEKIEVK